MRTGTSIGLAKPAETSSSRNLVTSENHASVVEVPGILSKDTDGFRNNYNRVFGRDISNIAESRGYAEQIPINPNKYAQK